MIECRIEDLLSKNVYTIKAKNFHELKRKQEKFFKEKYQLTHIKIHYEVYH